MNRKFFKTKWLWLFFVFLLGPIGVYALNTVDSGYRLNVAVETNIDAFGTCKKVINTSSKNYLIPTKTQNEWSSFRNAASMLAGITLQECCTANTSSACVGNDLYWFDSCGSQGSLKEDCGNNNCLNGACVVDTSPSPPLLPSPFCSANASSACFSNDVYWFDSCGIRGSVKADCGSNDCVNGACESAVPPPPPPPAPPF